MVQCHPKQGASLAPTRPCAIAINSSFCPSPWSAQAHIWWPWGSVCHQQIHPQTRSATTAPASHHDKQRSLQTSPDIFPLYCLLMQFLCLDITLHRHPFFSSSSHFRLYILGFDPLHQKIGFFWSLIVRVQCICQSSWHSLHPAGAITFQWVSKIAYLLPLVGQKYFKIRTVFSSYTITQNILNT